MIALIRIACAAAAIAVCGQAHAAPSMPIYFVGDWCFESQQGRTTSFLLPSATSDGYCKNVLSVMDFGFYGQDNHCEPLDTRLVKDEGHTGTAYIATIIARCQPDGPVGPGKLRTIEFKRYKGSLQVTPLDRAP